MSYSISRIIPQVNEANEVTSIMFDVVLFLKGKISAVRPFHKYYPRPLNTLESYSEDQLYELCVAVVEANGLANPYLPTPAMNVNSLTVDNEVAK